MKRLAGGFLILCALIPGSPEAGGEGTLESFFPSACGFWSASDSLGIFRGKKLYDLIDGGADIYLEYGFVRAGSRHYGAPDGGEISLEIHEMRDTLAAWGIFSFLAAGGTGVPSAIGQERVEGTDFVIYWKNRFLVLVTAMNEKGRAGLGVLAEEVSQLIRPAGRRPDLAEALLRREFRNSDVFLLKGPTAFDRGAEFGFGDIFRPRVGVTGLFDECRTFILRYAGARECQSAEREGLGLLKGRGGYSALSENAQAHLLSGPRGKVLHTAHDRRYLLLTIGENEEKVKSTAAALARAVSGHLKQ